MTQRDLMIFTGITLALALFSFWVSGRLFRRSRTDVFWRRRREAGRRGWRLFVVGTLLLILSGMSCVGTFLIGSLANDNEDKPTSTVAENPTGMPTETATPTDTVLPTTPTVSDVPTEPFTPIPIRSEEPLPSPTPQPSYTPFPSYTPAPTLTPMIIIVTPTPGPLPSTTPYPTFTPLASPTTLVSRVTPRPNARLTITDLDTQVSDEGEPVEARTEFPVGTSRIYYFVRFNFMGQGVAWKRYLYYQGEPITGGEYLWGPKMSGYTYFFFGSDSGFAPGEYEIRLFIDNDETPISAMSFEIVE
ncbi:MAG TPA: hypothetical protein VHP83_06335 [Aggregatilineaceae bacterium]|nr:hypothetical protein [Aggregatilineaceae bacterium]